MRQHWEPEDLIEVWTLLEDDMKKVRNKSGATRLGFALLLKSFEVEARFPESAGEMPAAAVVYVAQQVKVLAEAWAFYDWQGDRIKRHRREIREAYGFRANTEEDQERLAEWLAAELCQVELSRERLAAAVVARCRNDHIEPPAPKQVGRLVGKAVEEFKAQFCPGTMERLSVHVLRGRSLARRRRRRTHRLHVPQLRPPRQRTRSCARPHGPGTPTSSSLTRSNAAWFDTGPDRRGMVRAHTTSQ